ncbi:MAG: competence protein ComEC [Baekduia sp.]|nr:competence protein ComEC [Baekduia sp.]
MTGPWRPALAEAAQRHVRHVVLAAVLAGVALGPWVPASVVASAALALAAASVTVPLVRTAAAGVALAAVLVLGAVVADARTATLNRTHLTAQLGHQVTGEATVLAAPRTDAFGGRRALVRWREEPVLLRLPKWGPGVDAAVGDVLAVRGTLRPADLAATAVHAHATLRGDAVTATGRRRGGWLGIVDGVRRRAAAALAGHLPPAEAGLLRGMVLGDDAGLPDDVRDAFRAAGLTHLVAASGQNIMLLAALALGLSTLAGLPVRARWALVLVLIAVYVPLAGGGASIQRAGIMGAATFAAALAGRPAARWYALLLAGAATLLLDPRGSADAGWQLSFAAVLGIVLVAPRARERLRSSGLPAPIAEAVAVTLAATLATAPLIAGRFDRASLVALPANVLAAPAVAPVMWLGMVGAAVGQVAPVAASPLVALAGLPLGYLVGLGRLAAALPGAQVALPLAVVVILTALAAVLITAPPARERETGRRRPGWRRAALAAAVTLAVAAGIAPAVLRPSSVPPPPPGDLRVTALDIGQGDATLLQAGGHAVLVDAGPAGAGIVKALRRAGVRRLDALVVTHAQADHDGGVPALLAALPVGVLLDGRGGDRSPTSLAIDAPLRRRGTRVVPARAGQVLRAGPLGLRVLWPPPGPGMPGTDPNDRAIVAVADAYGARALLTADAESPVLAPLDIGHVDVLKVSHHGSADPGLPAFLARLQPRVALVEVGRHNTYGHPVPETMQALAAAVAVVRRTDRDGTIRIDLRAGAATVTSSGGGQAPGV